MTTSNQLLEDWHWEFSLTWRSQPTPPQVRTIQRSESSSTTSRRSRRSESTVSILRIEKSEPTSTEIDDNRRSESTFSPIEGKGQLVDNARDQVTGEEVEDQVLDDRTIDQSMSIVGFRRRNLFPRSSLPDFLVIMF